MTDQEFRDRIANIRRVVSLPDLLLSHGVKLRQSGQEFTACCIAHDDSNPSMSVYHDDGYWKWHCHACGAGTDVIDAYKTLTGCDHMESMDALDGGNYEGTRYATIENEPPMKKPDRAVSPPPPDAPPPPFNSAKIREGDEWVSMGDPVATWCYTTPAGDPWYYEARYEHNGKKEPRCWTWGRRGEQPARWEMTFPPKPRPLYGLHELDGAKQVLICEGPRKAEAARKLLNGTKSIACIGWPGGANGVRNTDWTPLQGKDLLLMPDADEPGINAMHQVAALAKARKMYMIDTAGQPKGWDAADAVAEGWDKQRFIDYLKSQKRDYVAPVSEPMPEHKPTPLPPPPAIEHYDGTDWPEPLDVFGEFFAPQVKHEHLPPAIADWCFDTAAVIGVDPTILAMPAIVAAASMLHDGIQVQPKDTDPAWRESARLWGAIVGEPSSKKSPAMSRALSVVKKIDSECNEREGSLRYEYSLQEKAHKEAENAYIKKLAAGEKNIPLPVKPDMPQIPRAIAQDFTIEALRDILKHSDRGILAERDELSGWFGSMDAYKQGRGGSDRAAWLETYNGGSRRIERVGVGSVFVKNWSCSIIGGIQPDPLRAISKSMHEDGLLQRFMVVYGRPGDEGNDQHPNRAYETRYKDALRQLWETQPHPDPVRLTPEASAIRKEIMEYAQNLINIKFVSTAMTAHLGKWGGLSARLMLTYHALACAESRQHPQASPISADTASRVKAFMLETLLPHATAFYMDVLGGSELTKQLNAVANLCLVKANGEISLRDITQGWIGWRHISEQIQGDVLNRLIDASWLIPAPGSRVNHRRNMATRYLINPRLKSTHEARIEAERKRRAEAKSIIDSIQGKRE